MSEWQKLRFCVEHCPPPYCGRANVVASKMLRVPLDKIQKKSVRDAVVKLRVFYSFRDACGYAVRDALKALPRKAEIHCFTHLYFAKRPHYDLDHAHSGVLDCLFPTVKKAGQKNKMDDNEILGGVRSFEVNCIRPRVGIEIQWRMNDVAE